MKFETKKKNDIYDGFEISYFKYINVERRKKILDDGY